MFTNFFKKHIPIQAPAFAVENRSGLVPPKTKGQTKNVAVATFDVSGGDSGAIGTFNTGVFIPKNAVITNVYHDVVTTFADGASDGATIATGITGTAGAFTAALAISDASNIWDAGLHGSKIGNFALDGNALSQIAMAAARVASWLKLSAEKEIIVTVGTHLLTAGKMNIFAEYVISD